MQNKRDPKRKLEEQKLFISHQIEEIKKRQDELILKKLFFDVQKDELEFRKLVLEKLIAKRAYGQPHVHKQKISGCSCLPLPEHLYLN
jgi:hypothetical protein